ncbi:glycosyltransferase [Oleiharenicola lentus]|uniref:Glycosyltransferase n=1 Tax=Oleiharenicola lentus TaxID=2508720 RepID=A0A4Q1CBN5_9BACT|nr:glycosyltransferase [Oleiharenicola lentus]RXK56523.1 glycosyltransferase [Oleiharenicola lentus]
MARIRIYLARHLCTAPRPQKEADALAAAGHEVTVHGVCFDPVSADRDAQLAQGRAWRWAPVADFTAKGQATCWLVARLRHRLARDWFALTGRVTSEVWGYAQGALMRHALQDPADLTIVHSEGGLAIAAELHRRGQRIGVDYEDWFSRDLPTDQQRGRPVERLAELEATLGRATPYATTTSRALAQALATQFKGPAPSVIYNTFPAGPEPEVTSANGRAVALHWFSQVIGPGRGLECLMAALPGLTFNWMLHLRGEISSPYKNELLARLPAELSSRIQFHPTVSHDQLATAIARHDIGLALEESTIPSRNLTLTNKFFHYLQSGLAVVASDTAGHREGLALAPGAGVIFPAGNAEALASALNRLAADPDSLLAARKAARNAFVATLAHETQAARYAALASAALAH